MKNFIKISAVIMFLSMFAFITSVKAQMSGTYTVGTTGTYTSLTAAYNALVSGGVNGPVILSVISDLSGQQTLSGTVTGASTTNTITITSSTGNPASYTIGTNSNYALYFQTGVSNLIVKDITIGVASYSNQYAGVYFEQSTTPYTNIEFRGCNINSYSLAPNSTTYASVYYSGQNSSSYYLNKIRFIRNNINGGYNNFYFNYLAGAATNMASRVGVTIDSNVLTDAGNAGIYSQNYAYYPSISYNTITSRSSSGTYYGIYTSSYTTIDSMIGNKITITSSSQAFGLYLYNYQNYNTTYGANAPMFIANNEIRIMSSASTAYGIYAYGTSSYCRFDIINNSIYMNGTSSCYGVQWYPSNNATYKSTFINNNMHINTSGTVYMFNFAGGTTYWGTTYSTVNYNNYYRTGTGTTYYGTNTYTTFAAFKAATSGQEVNSTNLPITYIDSTKNLELSSYTGFTCPQVAGVLKDIRNNTRGTTTYKGCYEPFILDAGIVKSASTPTSATNNQLLSLSASLKNFGLTTLTTATISWAFKDTVRTPPVSWAGSLSSGSTANISLGSAFITSGNTNPVKVWVSNPNSSTDPNTENDTINFTIYGCDSALKGNYTIGGAGADFATINDALMPLMNCGVSGPTTFLINSGTYNESISMIGAITGASATNTVTFTSAAGNADSVQVYPSTLGTTWTLSEISHLRFQDITIGTVTSVGEKAVVFDGNCRNITFYGCDLYAYTSATADTYFPVYYSNITAGKCLTDVKFIKNDITGGFVNMCFHTSSAVGATSMGSVTIDSNTLTEGYRGGIVRGVNSTHGQSYYMYFPSISYNTVIGRAVNSSYQHGISLGSVYQPPGGYNSYYDVVDQIVGNKIKIQIPANYGCGIQLSQYLNYNSPAGVSGAGTQCLIANNEIIHALTSGYSYGIYGANYPKADIINNSIYLKSTSASNPACGLYISNQSTAYGPMTIKNNNIVVIPQVSANGFPAYFADGAAYVNSSYKIMDYNNYYSSGGIIGYIGSPIYDLATWRSTTAQDAGTTNKYPSYTNFPNDLKVYGFGLACPRNASVLTDIDNTTRTTNTIMGAYEFTSYVDYDIQPYALVTPSTVVTNGIDEVVRIRLMNVGTTTVTSATINWKFNGVSQPAINWAGSIPSGNSVVVLIDTITPIGGTNTLVFITSLPNGQADTIRFNDTLSVSLFACDSALNGSYTVGSGGQYATLSDAVNALNSCGMTGPVTFAFITGIYPPMSISGTFNGSSTTNTVTFTSVSGNASDVTIGNSTTSYTTALALDRANNVIFKNITIGLKTSFTGYGVELKGLCSNILFYGCTIQTDSMGTNGNCIGVRYSGDGSSTNYLSNVRFIKNRITGGYYNFYFNYASGNNTPMGNKTSSIIIDSNILSNAYQSGININWMNRFPSISYNTITSRSNTPTNYYGIYSYYYTTIDSMIGNKISITGTAQCYGMNLSYYQNQNASYGAVGPIFIANNEIIVKAGGSSYGFYNVASSSDYSRLDLFHNSIYVSGTSNQYGVYLFPYTDVNSKIKFINNNVYVSTTGAGYMISFPTISYAATTYCTINYNNYYKPSGTAYYGSTSYTTLAAWVTAYSQDVNSTNTDPGFGASPINLIPVTWSACPVLTAVKSDINGNLRVGITYKGCYTAVFAADAAVSEFIGIGPKSTAGSNPINVRVVNYGTDTLKSVSVICSVNGVLQSPVILTGIAIPQYKDTIINIGTFVAVLSTTHTLKAWTYSPNGITDLNIANDTTTYSTIGCAQVLNGTYDIAGGNNDFASIALAMSALTNCGVSGPVVLRLATGNYTTLTSFSTVYDGTNATNTVTFTSLTGNANNVVIGAASSTALTLSGAKYLRFEKVTIGNTTGTTYGVYFQNANQNIEFYGCNIYSNLTSTATTDIPVYYSATVAGHCLTNVKFIKNNIKGGYVNMCLYSTSAVGLTNMGSVTIDSNTLTEGYRGGFARGLTTTQSYYMYFPSISYNTIVGRVVSSSYQFGIALGSVSQPPTNGYNSYYDVVDQIVGNKIKLQITGGTGCGIFLSSYLNANSSAGVSNAGTPCLIVNNEVIQSTTGSSYGILGQNQPKTSLLHNSIYLNASSNGALYGMYLGNTANLPMMIKNNILSVNNPVSYPTVSYPIYFPNGGQYVSSAYKIIDGNNYHSSGSNVAYAGGAITSLSGLQAATGQDVNSINQNPGFLAPTTNLHTGGNSMLLPRLSNVLEDLDGKQRISVTNMGCYHDFTPVALDVKLASIVSPAGSLVANAYTPINVVITNFGLTDLDSVKIFYSVNGGAVSSYNWTNGSLAMFASSSTINIGGFVPQSGFNTLVVYVAQPNGGTDMNTSNDTLSFTAYACDSMLSAGVYTVGTGGYFSNETQLMAVLTNCGVSGPISVQFLSGTYGSLNISNIPGSSAINTVTFTSFTGNATNVVIGNASGVALTLSEAKNLRFEKVTIGNYTGGTTYGVYFQNSNENIEFYGCNIYSSLTTSSEDYIPVYYSNTTAGKCLTDVKFIKNNIRGGFVNMCFHTSSDVGSTNMGSVTIDSNTLTEGYRGGIVRGATSAHGQSYYMYFPSISYNTVIGRAVNSSWQFGINLGSAYQPAGGYNSQYDVVGQIINNKIIIQIPGNYGCGIQLSAYLNANSPTGVSNAGTPCLVANNEIIHAVASGYSYGIWGGTNPKANILHNSIYLKNTTTSGPTYGLYISNNSTTYGPMTIKNNNIHIIADNNPGNGFPAYFNDGATYATSIYKIMDYNNYYSAAGLIGYIGTPIYDLASWRTITGQDTNTISVNPNFINLPLNLHTNGLSLLCIPLAEVPKDLNDTLRSALPLTNMGCYHDLNPLSLDAKLESIVSPTSTMSIGVSTPIQVKITNFGTTALDSIKIYWRVNGGSPNAHNWTGGPLSLFGTTSTISLGNFVPQSGFNTILVYVAQPNGGTDMNTSNDTLSITAFICDSVLNGTYTVGVGADFNDESEVIAALTNCGINGPVVLRFLSGTYGNLSIASIPGGSVANTVTFTSATGDAGSVVFKGTSTGDALFLNTASNMVFDRVTLDASSNSNGCGVKFMGLNSNILFTGCNIKADINTTSSSSAAVYYKNTNSSTIYLQNVKFVKNKIDGGYYNFYFNYASGNNVPMGTKTASIIIDSNVLSNAYQSGIFIDYMARFPSISYNTITSRSNTPTNYYGIYSQYYTTIDSMIGNKISITGTAQCMGMRLGYYQNYNTSYGADGPMFIANNEIIINAGGSSYGFYDASNSQYSRFDIYHNSIYVSGTSNQYGVYLYPYNSASYRINFLNNNVYVNTTGPAYLISFGAIANAAATYCTLNYNNYYSPSGTTYFGSTSYTTLAAWKSAYSQDANSVTLSPSYLNVNTSLELTGVGNSGITCPRLAYVLTDLINNARSTPTYMGCYEPSALDAAIDTVANTKIFTVAYQLEAISALLKNVGLTTLTSDTIYWSFKDTLRPSIPWAGSLASGANATISLGNVFITPGFNKIKMWTSKPNGLTDPNPTNDTISYKIFACGGGLSGNYSIGTSGADFETIGEALTSLNYCGIGGPVTFSINNGTYNESISIIGAILGADTTNTVTFTSTSGNASSVQIYVSGTTLTLNETANLRFKNITIGTQASSGEKAVLFVGNCSNIEFYGCNLNAYATATATTYFPVYYDNSTAGKCLTEVKFIKNNITGGYANICLFTAQAVGAAYMGSVTIDSNILTEGYRGGIARGVTYTPTPYYMYFPSISYNTIIGRATSSSYQYGIALGSVYSTSSYPSYYDVVDKIVGNKIKLQVTGNYGYGIWLSNYLNRYSSAGVNNAGTQCLIANNEIIHNTTDCYSYGIYGTTNPKANIINNSIYLKNTNVSYSLHGLYISNNNTSYGPMTIKNNNIVVIPQNPANGFPAYFNDGVSYVNSSYKIMDYNNYYSSGGLIGYIGSPIYDLATWRSITAQDTGTTNQYPSFVNSANNLKVYGFNLACPRISSVLTDIENTIRATTTIMGCYEFIPSVNYDIQPHSLISPSMVVSAGVTESVKIKLMNVGATTLTSAIINWKFNNVAQPTVNWNGSLASGNSAVVTLGNITPISKANSLLITTSLPNGQPDAYVLNDTLTVSIFACDSMLNGNYTIGTGGDFASADEVLGVLYSCGINGAVTLSFITGTYPPLSLMGSINGASPINTITFTSATGNASNVVIGNSTTTYTTALTLDRASNIIFKNITIGLNTSFTGFGVELKGLCSNILFYGCTIQTDAMGTNSNHIGVRGSGTSNSSTDYLSNVRFIKNTITGGYYNFYFNYASGNNVPMSNKTSSIILDSNTLSNAYQSGIYSSYYNRFLSISYNTITSRINTATTYYGIRSEWYNTIDTMQGNRIFVSGTSACYGLYFYAYQNSSTSYGATGSMFIVNNEVIVKAGGSTSYAFYDQSNNGWNSRFDIFHNSFYVSGTGALYGAYFYTYDTNYKYTFLNNNVYLSTAGTGYMIHFGNAANSTTAYGVIDYNNYYKPSGTVYYGNSYTSLGAWQTGRSQDMNSTNTDPGFAATPSDLKPTTLTSLLCPVLTQVPADILGLSRTTFNNNKGCYTKIVADDAALTAFVSPGEVVIVGNISVSVKLANYGSSTLTNVRIGWSVNGSLQTPLTLTGLNLAQYQDTVIVLGTFLPTVANFTNVKAYSYLPNGNADLNTLNDTVSINTYGCSSILHGSYTVGIGKDFADLADVYTSLHYCGVNAPVTFLLDSGNYGDISIAEIFPGTSTTNTVTLASATGDSTDVVFSSTTGVAITLQNTAHLILHKVTLDVTSGTIGIEFIGGSEDIQISNCDIKARTTSSSTYRGISRNNAASPLSNIRILNNNIDGGYYGIYLYGYSSTNDRNTDIVINNNRINSMYYGIQAYYTNTNQINGNTITQHMSSASAYNGMYFSNCYAKEIVGNRIRADYNTSHGIYGTSFGTASSSLRLLIANNEMILTTLSSGIGIYFGTGGQSYTDFYHNSILFHGTSAAQACLSLLNSGANVNIKNNNFINVSGNSSSSTTYAFYVASLSYLNTTTMDYNNYYTLGTRLMYAGSAIDTLAMWKLTTGKDTNSISILPHFVNPTTFSDLHTDGSSMFCPVLSEVAKDIDNTLRSSSTIMGCYHDNFIPIGDTFDTLSICDNELPYTYGDSILTSAGSYQIMFTSYGGYDSLVKLTLYVNLTYTHMDTIAICNYELPYSYGDSIFATAGDYNVHLTSINGCDSIIYVKLDVFNCQGSDTVDICSTDLPYAYGDSIFTSSGNYQVVFKGSGGLDSIVALTLRVHSTYNHYDTVSICNNELPYSYGDSTFAIAGNYGVHFSSVYGCDSLISLKLYVNPTYSGKDTVTLCSNQLPLNYGDSAFATAGSYNVHFKTVNGCDSLIALRLYVNPTYSGKDTVTICSNQLPLNYGDSIFATAGSYNVHFKTVNGCDSLIALRLYVNPTYSGKDTVTICSNQLPFNYGDSIFAAAGSYNVHFKAVSGCDSLIALQLYVNLTYTHKDTVTICQNQLPYNYGGSSLTATGSYNKHFTAVNGCDSLVTLQLYVNPTYNHTDTVSICTYELPYSYGDSIFATAGSYDVYFTTVKGCDSIVELRLNTFDCQGSDVVDICSTDLPYTYGDSIFTGGGVYQVVFKGYSGHDSTIVLTLRVHSTYDHYDTLTVCNNEFPFVYSDSTILLAGDYLIEFNSIWGCDSTVYLTVHAIPAYDIYDTISICDNDLPYMYGDSVFTQEGDYVVYFHSILGCDSIINLQLNVVNGVPTAPLQIYGDTAITTAGGYTYYVDPVATADYYVWTISNNDWTGSSTTETINIAIPNAGSGIISVKAVNICGESDTISLDVFSSVNITEMEEMKCVLGQNIPNPSSVTAKIPYAIPLDGEVVFNVMSVSGQVLYREKIQVSSGTHYLELNTQSLPNGIYYYSMEYNGQRLVKKMTIQK